VTPEAAIQKARAGELLPVYLLAGDEQFLRDQVVAELRAASLGGAVAAFNEDRFTAGEGDVEKVIAAARTVPMMAARRFVLVRGADRWDSGGGSDDAGSPLDRLAAYAGDPSPSTCMVVTATKLDGRRKLTALAKKQDFVVACEPLDTRGLVSWVLARTKAKGHAMDREVAELLAEIGGPELAYVNDALERLSLYVGDGQPITENAVAECVVRVRTADTWALVAAVGARDLGKALQLLSEVYDPRSGGLMLLGALAWSIRQLAKYHAATAAGASHDDAAKRAGVYQPYRAKELAARARGITRKQVERWLLVLAETDVFLKSSRRPPDAILEEMLTKLCKR
jgi:DNA polymerase-3 subunit delta